MEAVAIAEKPWQLAGEITAANRPENSLLQENLDFEHMTRLRELIVSIVHVANAWFYQSGKR